MEDKAQQKQVYELHQRESRIISQTPEELKQIPVSEIQQLIHDQAVHEIELENQNKELKAESAKLDESRRQCLDLFDFAPITYFNLDREGVIISANFIAGDMLAASRLELINKNFTTFIEPQYQEAFERYLQDIVASGRRESLEVEMHRTDGTQLFAQLETVAVPDEKNTIYRVSAIDITRRRIAEDALQDSEERFRNIFESSPIGIELYDAEGGLITANKSCLEIFGISSVEQVKGFKLFEDPNVTPEVKERLRRKETVRWKTAFDFELVTQHNLYPTNRSGVIYLDVLVTPLSSSRDTLKGYLIQLQDVTEREQVEHDLQEQIKELQSKLERW